MRRRPWRLSQPITPALRDALPRQREMADDKEGWIFPAAKNATKYPHRRDMREQFSRAAVRAGLDPTLCTPRVMRHTAITSLVKQKVDAPTIQKISGHKTLSMVMHYVQVFGQHIDDAIGEPSIDGAGEITPELHTAPRPSRNALDKLMPINL